MFQEHKYIRENEKFKTIKKFKIFVVEKNQIKEPTEIQHNYYEDYISVLGEEFDSEEEVLNDMNHNPEKYEFLHYSEFIILPIYRLNVNY
ncbi:MAG: hypothetical protein CL760_07285 [Chloroflexi bacterium]|nr:hypothetical protein [Chloroflexota bacterium]|tara:strand:- start:15472 stop:15741 length:270 start_codon:yes stop_codon:yes gene_type:complete